MVAHLAAGLEPIFGAFYQRLKRLVFGEAAEMRCALDQLAEHFVHGSDLGMRALATSRQARELEDYSCWTRGQSENVPER